MTFKWSMSFISIYYLSVVFKTQNFFSVRYSVYMVSVEMTKYHFALESLVGLLICTNMCPHLIFTEAWPLRLSVLLVQSMKAQISVLIALPSSMTCAPVRGQLKEQEKLSQ